MDADLEYDPANIARLLEPLQAGDARAVFGTGLRLALGVLLLVRRRQQDRDPDHQPALQLVAVGHHDLPQARGTDLFRSLPLRERGFAIEPEITARLLLAGVRIYEVPSPTGRARAREGKKLTTLDGLRVPHAAALPRALSAAAMILLTKTLAVLARSRWPGGSWAGAGAG